MSTSSFEGEEEDNNPFTSGLSQMDFPYQKRLLSEEEETSKDNVNSIDSPSNREQLSKSNARAIPSQSEAPQYQRPESLVISIIDANKTSDGHSTSGFITYTISYNGTLIRRRYREFESFRNSLVALFPTTIVPPIPTKQTLTDILSSATSVTSKATNTSSLVNSTNNFEGLSGNPDSSVNIIDHRKRMLSIFLNRCLQIPKIRDCDIFRNFLDPNLNWTDVLNHPPLSQVPKNPLQCDPIHPEKSKLLHSLMPIPSSIATSSPINLLKNATNVNGSDHRRSSSSSSSGDEIELASRIAENNIMVEIDKVDKKNSKYLADISNISSELGILFNAFSLQESDQLAALLEKISTNYDQNYLNLENLCKTLYLKYSEPLLELSQFSNITKKLIKFKNKKLLQLKLISDELARKEKNLKNLTVGYSNWENSRLNETLSKFDNNGESGPDGDPVTAAVKFKIPGVNKLTSVFKERIYDSDPVKTHRDKVNKLIFDIDQLKKIQELANKDFKVLETEIDKELQNYEKYFKSIEFKKLLLELVKDALEYARNNLENWEEFRAVLDK